MSGSMTRFIVDKADLRQGRFVDAPLPGLQPGEVLLRVDSFAFTANNITYAELGERMAYWQFFPADAGNGGADGWGSIPVWGFADVVASRHDAVREGERIYGYLPMATHLLVQPDRVNPGSFVDACVHRQKLPPAYNLYTRCAGDPSYRRDEEALYALLRPLFITSFLIDDFFADENFFGVSSVLLSSASSKTAFALAWLLHRRRLVEVIGLTSPGNRGFVESLGCYDRATLYDGIAGLPHLPAAFVDFAGSAAVRVAVHQHYREDMKYSCAVGMSHRDHNPPGKGLPGAKPVFFFAPDRLRKRAEDWGRDGLSQRVAAAWADFVPAAKTWLKIIRGNRAAVAGVYAATLNGKVRPEEGHILSLQD